MSTAEVAKLPTFSEIEIGKKFVVLGDMFPRREMALIRKTGKDEALRVYDEVAEVVEAEAEVILII
jgi:hypothetical protein